MSVNIVTTEDLKDFKEQLLGDIQELLEKYGQVRLDKWIKSSKVMEKLEISPGTLQNLRDNGTIPYTKLEGTLYYDEEEIEGILRSNKAQRKIQGYEDSKF